MYLSYEREWYKLLWVFCFVYYVFSVFKHKTMEVRQLNCLSVDVTPYLNDLYLYGDFKSQIVSEFQSENCKTRVDN